MENKTKIRVCVIGGGAGGLICSKRLLEKKNIIVESYERSNNVGGLWVYDDGPNGKMYTSLRANTSKILMAFPEYPMPEEWPEFPSHWMMAEYLQGFANTFLKALDVLNSLHKIENIFGRERKLVNEPRVIDLDLIDYLRTFKAIC